MGNRIFSANEGEAPKGANEEGEGHKGTKWGEGNTTDDTDEHGLLPATSTGNPHPALRATLSQWEKDGNQEGVRHIRLRCVAGYGVTGRREALKVLAGHRRLRLSRGC